MKIKKILIIFGHPSKKSFNRALMKSYIKGLKEANHSFKMIDLVDLKLEIFLKNSYKEELMLPKSLVKVQNEISWANQLVFFFPVWWATPPALMKLFLEVVLQKNFAYRYQKPILGFFPKWKKLLKGKTARIVMTMDSPVFYYRFFLGSPAYKMMKVNLNFCGIGEIKTNYFGFIELSSNKKRKKWLEKIYKTGLNE